jgi:hypothetical protein
MSIAAGAVHAGLGPEHFAEWWGYGAFFVVAATAQVLLGLALLTDAIDPKGVANPARVKRWMYALGAVGQVALIALYVVTRTTGIPWLGPQAGVVEEVAPLDIITKIIEAGCAAILVMLLVRGARKPT